jgi:hypothetical protein
MPQWYVPICSFFKGRLIDKPTKTPMPETPQTSGGEIEHKVFLFDNLTLLIKVVMNLTCTWDYCAQVLLELVCEILPFVARYCYLISIMNHNKDLDPQPPVYAILTDLRDFYFLSYDGTKFRRMATIIVPREPLVPFMKGMTQGMHVFYAPGVSY